jgi:hypothetical protein
MSPDGPCGFRRGRVTPSGVFLAMMMRASVGLCVLATAALLARLPHLAMITAMIAASLFAVAAAAILVAFAVMIILGARTRPETLFPPSG